jgi:predicted nucleotidyltransferase
MGRRGIRTHRYTFMMSRIEGETDQIELYDNRSDMYQLRNISDQRQDIIDDLYAELKMWLKKTDDPWIKHIQ